MAHKKNKNYSEDEMLLEIEKFLMINGFRQTSLDVLEAIAQLVFKSIQNGDMLIGQAYEELASSKSKSDSFRSKLGTHIKTNFPEIKKNIFEKYEYNIGDFYGGVKNFVDQIALVCMILLK